MVTVVCDILAEIDVPQVGEVIVKVGGGKALAFANRVTSSI